MNDDRDAPLETVWQGKYISALKRGRWEFVSRTGSTHAVVIIAEHEGKVILIEQFRVPVGGRCLELPAGLVGDEDKDATVEGTAVKELEEENRRLKKMYAEAQMDASILKEALTKKW